MRQQVAGGAQGIRVDQRALAGAVVARFVVLQSEVRHVIAQRVKEVIAPVVARAEERAGFLHQVLEMADQLGAGLQRAVAIGRHVQVVRSALLAAQFERLVMGAGRDGRIHHRGQRRRLELDLVAALALDRQRGAVAPAAGHRQRGLVLESSRAARPADRAAADSSSARRVPWWWNCRW